MAAEASPLKQGARWLGAASIVAFVGLVTRSADAGGTVPGTIASSVTIVLTCLMTTTNLSFGTYLNNQTGAVAAPATPGTVTINCGTTGVALSFHLDSTGTISSCALPGGEHKMLKGASPLCYHLTGKAPGGSATALNTSATTIAYTTTAATANGAVFTLSGSIPGSQSAPNGVYTDTMPIAVDY